MRDDRKRSSDEAREQRVSAARSLGERLDHGVEALARTPKTVVRILLVAGVALCFPFDLSPASALGVKFGGVLPLWLFHLALVAVLLVILAACFFVVRAMVTFIEEGRWPKRAAGVDIDEVDGALDQIERGAEELSTGADNARVFERRLKEANETIRYLATELARERGDTEGQDHPAAADAQDERQQ